MSAIEWNSVGDRRFEAGVDRGVLYVDDQDGVPWNGLTEVSEKASGGSATPYYVDGIKYLNISSPEEYAATITAFTYPDEFMVCDGTALIDTGLFVAHQPRKPFSFTYRTMTGNDVEGADYAYKIHLVYNALAEPSTYDHKSISDTVTPEDFSWDLSLQPPSIPGFYGSGHLIFDTRSAHPGAVAQLEQVLYGTDDTDPRFPQVDEILAIIAANANITVVDNDDGTFTLTADDDALTVTADTYEVNSNAVTVDSNGVITISTN